MRRGGTFPSFRKVEKPQLPSKIPGFQTRCPGLPPPRPQPRDRGREGGQREGTGPLVRGAAVSSDLEGPAQAGRGCVVRVQGPGSAPDRLLEFSSRVFILFFFFF